MRKNLLLSLLIASLLPAILLAQRDSLRDDFMNAESWLLLEEYDEALPLYLKLQQYDPENDNLNYKIGICLLNDPYRKDESISYLLKASQNINPRYKENNFKENTAPPDALFYLGKAYLVNDMLDKALATYERFLDDLDPEIYDEQLVLKQIQACKNARKLKSMPVDIDLVLLDSLINTRYADVNPVVSGDGTRMVFVTKLPFYDGAFYTEKVDGEWQYPRLITTTLGFDEDVYPVGLSWDGTEMFLYYDDDYIGNLYYSKFEDGDWTPAVKLEAPISTKYWESHACLSRDGKSLYFTSNRKGGFGGLDIYRSDRQADGSWGEPVNLGPTVNSPYNEETPFITEDGNTLYFSSYGHYNMGGYDVFYSRKKANGTWGEPVNMGYPINTTDDDLFFQPLENGFQAYYALYSNRGMGQHDIFHVNVYSVDNPRMYLITGNLRTEDGIIDPERIAIFAVDSRTGDTVVFAAPDRESGAFAMKLKQGIYDLHFTGPGYEELIRPLEITPASNKAGIRLDEPVALALIPREPLIFEGEESLVQLRDTLFEGFPGRTIRVPMRLERDGVLITKLYRDSVLVRTDTIDVERRRTALEIDPGEGAGRYELEFIDAEGNIHRGGFVVEAVAPVHERPREFKALADAGDGEASAGADQGAAGREEGGPAGTGTGEDAAAGTDRMAGTGEDDSAGGPDTGGPDAGQEETMGAALNRLRKTTDGVMKEVVDDIYPWAERIDSVEDLIARIYRELERRGYGDDEILEMLMEHFGSHEEYIRELGVGGGVIWPVVVLAIAGAGLFVLLVLFIGRRKKEKGGED